MVVDASDRPVRVTSHPYMYPSPASSGESTTTFGTRARRAPSAGRRHGLYFGHKGFIRGSFTFDEHNSFQRYATVAEAVAALYTKAQLAQRPEKYTDAESIVHALRCPSAASDVSGTSYARSSSEPHALQRKCACACETGS